MSQADWADLFSVTPLQVSTLLSGKVNFDLQIIAKFQSVMGVPIIEVTLFENHVTCSDHILNKRNPKESDMVLEVKDLLIGEEENQTINPMKFNLKILKAISQPMSPEALAALYCPVENADWLLLSAAISLKVRKIMRYKGMSQTELADIMTMTSARVSKLLTGKVNFDLQTSPASILTGSANY